ncbi:hypothetical protein GE061_006037 [Apolygus lucorum]|uniref:Uncharacterized protein n=1 Tax=Apolygus lucorum TaxID=248454 RepID=A0A8S9WU63_APOLU|nr:hypothetical protein GE061_006037 [Apolygus lucorum]
MGWKRNADMTDEDMENVCRDLRRVGVVLQPVRREDTVSQYQNQNDGTDTTLPSTSRAVAAALAERVDDVRTNELEKEQVVSPEDGGLADVSAGISAIQDYRTSSNEPSLDHLSDNLSQSAPDVNGGRRKRAHEELIDHKSEDDIVVQAECAPPSPDEPPVKPVLDPSLEEYLLMEDDGGIAELIDIIPPPKEEMTPKTEGVGQPGSTNPGTVGSPATPLDIDTLPSTSELCERSTVPPNDAPEEWSPNLVVPGPSTAEPVVEAMMEEEEPIEPPPRYTFRQRVPVDYNHEDSPPPSPSLQTSQSQPAQECAKEHSQTPAAPTDPTEETTSSQASTSEPLTTVIEADPPPPMGSSPITSILRRSQIEKRRHAEETSKT